jgi:hypothetical protein
MSDPHEKEKVEEKPKEFKKTPEYRKFRKLLKQVIKAPPMRKHKPIHSDG